MRIPWNEVIDECYDKQLNFWCDIAKVIYTDERTERAVILQRSDGLYETVIERLYPFDDEELKYVGSDLHGYWSPHSKSKSIFDTVNLAVNSIMAEPPFKDNNLTL